MISLLSIACNYILEGVKCSPIRKISFRHVISIFTSDDWDVFQLLNEVFYNI